tara:strand:- start:77 stop:1948 length:1872 start_codon:yes stop_codon:yes gene_type:complete
MSSKKIDRKIAVIFVADVVGYSKHMERDENETLKNYSECEKILNKLLKKYKGKIFNTAGDSVLAEFSSAVNAVECGAAFQNEIKKKNQLDYSDVKLEFRLGINMGDVVSKDGNLLGDGVNIAARLEALAQPGGITISKSIYDFVVPKTKMTFNDLGVQKVKQNEFHAYDILLHPSQKRTIRKKNNGSTLLISGICAFVIIIGALVFYLNGAAIKNDNSNQSADAQVSDKPILLIKPFKMLAKNPGFDYIASGFTGYLNTTLSQIPRIEVLPETTASHIAENNLTNEQIRDQYNVDYIVEANIQISGEKIRISSKVSNAVQKKVVSSENYELNENQIFEYQDRIAELILQKMSVRDAPTGQRISENPEVYKKHLIAYGHFINWTPDGHYEAEKIWTELVQMEPENHSLSQMLGWLLQQKVALGLSKDPIADFKEGLGIALTNIKSEPTSIDPLTLAATMEGYLGEHQQACDRLPLMHELLEKKMRESIHVAMVGYINQNCEEYNKAIELYEHVFNQSPYFPAWIRYYYVYALLASDQLEKAKEFAIKNSDLNYSYYGTNEVLKLTLVFIAHKQNELKLAKKYFLEYETMEETLSANYLKTDFGASKSKKFINEFNTVLNSYGFK